MSEKELKIFASKGVSDQSSDNVFMKCFVCFNCHLKHEHQYIPVNLMIVMHPSEDIDVHVIDEI